MPGRAMICRITHGTAAPTASAIGSCENGAMNINATAM
jgi:hypothetical protein